MNFQNASTGARSTGLQIGNDRDRTLRQHFEQVIGLDLERYIDRSIDRNEIRFRQEDRRINALIAADEELGMLEAHQITAQRVLGKVDGQSALLLEGRQRIMQVERGMCAGIKDRSALVQVIKGTLASCGTSNLRSSSAERVSSAVALTQPTRMADRDRKIACSC